jgi:hypothetical protein
VRPGVDAAFAAIVMCALEREPDLRWASARAMRDALAGYLAGRPAETAATRVLVPEDLGAGAEPDSESLPPDAIIPDPVTPPPPPSVPAAARTVVSARRAPSRRSNALPLAAGAVLALVVLGVSGLIFIRSTRKSAEGPSAPPPVAPTAVNQPAPEPTALPLAPSPAPVTAPTVAPVSAPTAAPEPAATAIRLIRPTRPPDPPPPAPRKPVTPPERLTPDPPFAGAPPAGCSGAAVTVGFAVDPDGNVVAPRLFPSDAAPECGRFVMDALSRWKWRPAVDATGAPVLSTRLVASVQLP